MFEGMPMKSAVKISLLVDEQDASILDGQSRIANWLYNKLLERANDLRLCKAIQDYQDGKHGRRAEMVYWPRFRAWKRHWFSLQYDPSTRNPLKN
jgi:putative transposase